MFTLNSKIYGREQQISTLLNCYKEVLLTRDAHLVWLEGESGMGKSFLINAIKQDIIDQGSWFFSVKFETPISSSAVVFTNIFQQIFLKYKASCKSNNLEVAPKLVDLFDKIMAESGQISQDNKYLNLSYKNIYNRLYRLSRLFFKNLPSKAPPIVLFFDDLQWIDQFSLLHFSILTHLLEENNLSNVLIINAYRLESLKEGNIFLQLKETKYEHTTIRLKALSKSAISNLLTDHLSRLETDTQLLTEIVLKRTLGNPLYIKLFLTSAFKHNFIRKNKEDSYWEYKLDSIKNLDVAENVAAYLSKAFQQKDDTYQQVLAFSAALGNRVDQQVLSAVLNIPTLQKFLDQAVVDGFLIKNEKSIPQVIYQFTHDKIWEVAYSIIPSAQRPSIHLDIARTMALHQVSKKNSINLARHYFNGRSALSLKEEIIEVANLFLVTARRMRENIDFERSNLFTSKALELLNLHQLKLDNKSLYLTLYFEFIQSAFLNGQQAKIEQAIDQLEQDKQYNFQEIFPAYRFLIRSFSLNQEHKKASDKCRALLLTNYDIDIHFPCSLKIVVKEYFSVLLKTNFNQLSKFNQLKTIKDISTLQLLSLLTATGMAIHNLNKESFAQTVLTAIRIIIKHGHSKYSSAIISAYGLILCQGGNILKGYQLGNLSEQLLKSNKDKTGYRYNALHIIYGLIKFWKEPLRKTLPPLLHLVQESADHGYLTASANLTYSYLVHSYYAGVPLHLIRKDLYKLKSHIAFKSAKDSGIHNSFLKLLEQVIHNLTSSSLKNIHEFNGEYFSESKDTQKLFGEHDEPFIASFYFFKMQLAYFDRAFDVAYDYSQKLEAVNYIGMLFSQSLFYISLAQIAMIRKNQKRYSHLFSSIKKNQKQLKKYARYCPENFKHQWALVEAELKDVQGKPIQAQQYYEQAISYSKENGFHNDEALAWECYGYARQRNNAEVIANTFLSTAKDCYQTWGAFSKVSSLSHTYNVEEKPSSFNEQDNALLGLARLIRHKNTHEDLLDSFIKLLHKLSGTKYGRIILKIEEEWQVLISNSSNQNKHTGFFTLLNQSEEVPKSIIGEVIVGKQALLLENASHVGDFTSDPYLSKAEEKSIYCLPLITNNEIEGILYLEDNQSTLKIPYAIQDTLQSMGSIFISTIRNAYLKKEIQARVFEQTKEIQEQQDFIQVLVDELKHRYGNILGTIHSLLSKNIDSDQPHSVLKESISRLEAAIELHHAVYDTNYSNVYLYDYFGKIIDATLRIYGHDKPEDIHIDLDKIEVIKILPSLAINIGLIVCELTINTCKYAFPFLKSKELSISFIEKLKNNMPYYYLTFKDNGPGFPINNLQSQNNKKRNLNTLNSFILKLDDGQISIKNKKGASVQITFKKNG